MQPRREGKLGKVKRCGFRSRALGRLERGCLLLARTGHKPYESNYDCRLLSQRRLRLQCRGRVEEAFCKCLAFLQSVF